MLQIKGHYNGWYMYCKLEISPEQLVALVQQMPIWLLYHRHQRQSNNCMNGVSCKGFIITRILLEAYAVTFI